MLIPRTAEICIVCLKEPPFSDGNGFSKEHIIPAAIGGILTCEFLCKSCNNGFGGGFERRAKTDPSIRNAIYNLREKLPDLYASMEQGQKYIINTSVGDLSGQFHDGEVSGQTKKLPDGSLMASAQDTRKILCGMLSKEGFGKSDIEKALKRFDAAPEEQLIEITPKTSVIKRVATVTGRDLKGGKIVDPLVCLKIAYEFAALLFGPPVFADNPALNEMRRALREENSTSPVFNIEPLIATQREYAAFHGILFEGDDHYSKFQIRLFGRLAYRVHLPNLKFDHKPVKYTHDLAAATERLD